MVRALFRQGEHFSISFMSGFITVFGSSFRWRCPNRIVLIKRLFLIKAASLFRKLSNNAQFPLQSFFNSKVPIQFGKGA